MSFVFLFALSGSWGNRRHEFPIKTFPTMSAVMGMMGVKNWPGRIRNQRRLKYISIQP